MTLPEIILACVNSRRGALFTGRSKKHSHDNFEGPVGRLLAFAASHPKGGAEAVERFFAGIWYRDFLFVRPKSPSGEAIEHRLEQLRPK